jgi:hypothetical protein
LLCEPCDELLCLRLLEFIFGGPPARRQRAIFAQAQPARFPDRIRSTSIDFRLSVACYGGTQRTTILPRLAQPRAAFENDVRVAALQRFDGSNLADRNQMTPMDADEPCRIEQRFDRG